MTILEQSNTRMDRIKSWIAEAGKDRVAIAGTVVASLALGTYGIVGGIKQGSDVEHSLRADAKETIDGYLDADIEGHIFNMSPGSLHGAVVTLATGDTCDVQFTTVEGEGFLNSIFPNEARIVSYGTCPTIED